MFSLRGGNRDNPCAFRVCQLIPSFAGHILLDVCLACPSSPFSTGFVRSGLATAISYAATQICWSQTGKLGTMQTKVPMHQHRISHVRLVLEAHSRSWAPGSSNCFS